MYIISKNIINVYKLPAFVLMKGIYALLLFKKR